MRVFPYLCVLGIYGFTTVCQIKDGKQMYQALETYLTLYKKHVQNLVECSIAVQKDLQETITAAIINLRNYVKLEKVKLRRNNRDALEVLKTTDFHIIRKEFDD